MKVGLKTNNANTYRSIQGEIRNLERRGEFLFNVELWLLNDAVNENNWRFTDLPGNQRQFAGTPILVAYTAGGRKIGDGHNFSQKKDPKTGETVVSFTGATAERIVGSISEDPQDIRLEQVEGKTWIVAKGTLWRWYARELVEKIEHDALQGRKMSVSIEALVTKSHMEGRVEVEDEYKILGTTILGDDVSPAVTGAHIAALTKREAFKDLKIRAASYNPAACGAATQKNFNEKKGQRKMSVFNQPQLADLQKRFSGYTVLSAVRDDAGVHVALRDAGWGLYAYDMANETDTVAPENIHSCAAQMHFDNGCVVDAFSVMAEVLGELSRVNGELETAKNAVSERDCTISAMRDTEAKRRVAAAKAAAESTLERFNAGRSEKIGADVLADVHQEIEAGLYTSQTDDTGAWTGDKAVEDRVYAICGRKVQEQQEELARNSRKTFVWDNEGAGHEAADDGSIESLLARNGIE